MPLVGDVHDGSAREERRHGQQRAQPPPAPQARALPHIGWEARSGSRLLGDPCLAESCAAQRRFLQPVSTGSLPEAVIESLGAPPEILPAPGASIKNALGHTEGDGAGHGLLSSATPGA